MTAPAYTKAEFVKFDFDLSSFTVDRASAELLIATPDVAILLYRVDLRERHQGRQA